MRGAILAAATQPARYMSLAAARAAARFSSRALRRDLDSVRGGPANAAKAALSGVNPRAMQPQATAAMYAHGAATAPRPDHLTRTAEEPRGEIVSEATLVAVHEETPTVRELTLRLHDADFTFKPGNWVDFFIPGVEKVGGYSICSLPAELPLLRLAVKRSQHPPAAWCHSNSAAPGAVVQVKAGGQFCWDPAVDSHGTSHLLLVAGGIGINPLYSILQAAVAAASELAPSLRHITMLYSAASAGELAFRGHLQQLAACDTRVRLAFHVTREARPPAADAAASAAGAMGADKATEGLRFGRITPEEILGALHLAETPSSEVLAYVCGPPSMTDEMCEALTSPLLSVPHSRVRSERWW